VVRLCWGSFQLHAAGAHHSVRPGRWGSGKACVRLEEWCRSNRFMALPGSREPVGPGMSVRSGVVSHSAACRAPSPPLQCARCVGVVVVEEEPTAEGREVGSQQFARMLYNGDGEAAGVSGCAVSL